MRLRLILVGVLGLSMFLACVALRTALFTPPKLDRAHMRQIQEGMTREEVEAVLGVPPGIYTDRQIMIHAPPRPDEDSDWIWEFWICDEGELVVLFKDGRAERVLVHLNNKYERSPFDRLPRIPGL